MATMEAQNGSYHPMGGANTNAHTTDHVALGQEQEQEHHHNTGGVQFTDSFSHNNNTSTEATHHHEDGPRRERKGSKDYSHTDEWDASKTVPSRFQQRKGSIFATPSSRDGHVQKNLDNDAEFHKQHSKRFSFSKAKDTVSDLVGGGGGSDSRRRRSSAGHSSTG